MYKEATGQSLLTGAFSKDHGPRSDLYSNYQGIELCAGTRLNTQQRPQNGCFFAMAAETGSATIIGFPC